MRTALFCRLLEDGPQSVTDLVKHVNAQEPTVSHHLTRLRMAKLVTVNRKGRFAFYRVAELPEDVKNGIMSILSFSK